MGLDQHRSAAAARSTGRAQGATPLAFPWLLPVEVRWWCDRSLLVFLAGPARFGSTWCLLRFCVLPACFALCSCCGAAEAHLLAAPVVRELALCHPLRADHWRDDTGIAHLSSLGALFISSSRKCRSDHHGLRTTCGVRVVAFRQSVKCKWSWG